MVPRSRMVDLMAVPPFSNAGMRNMISQVCLPFEKPQIGIAISLSFRPSRVSPTELVRVAWMSKYWYIWRRWHLAHFLFLVLLLLLHLDILLFFSLWVANQYANRLGGNSYWCLWDIRIGVFEVIGELVVIRHRLHSYLPDLTLILLSPRSFPRVPEVGFEAFWLGFPGSWVRSSCEVSYPFYLRQRLRTHRLSPFS